MKKTVSVLLAILTLLSVFSLNLTAADAAGTYESAVFPMNELKVVRTNVKLDKDQQKYADKNGGHVKFAWDLAGSDTSLEAPFTGKVLYIDKGNEHAVFFQSCSKVYMPDGRLDYLTLMLVHDDNVSDLKVGQVIRQGQHLYDQGTFGKGRKGAYARHVHIEAAVGKIGISTKNKVGKNMSLIRDAKKGVQLYDCFYLNANCKRTRDYIVVRSLKNKKITFGWKMIGNLNKATVSAATVAFTGRDIGVAGALNVKYGKTRLKAGRDYTVSVAAVKDVGRYDVTVTGIYGYVGTLKTTVTVTPAIPSFGSGSAKDNLIPLLTSSENSSDCGYQIRMGKKKDLSDAKTYCINCALTENSLDASAFLKAVLFEGGTRYVRVCACRRVSYHGKSIELRSDWSEVTSVKF